MKTGICELYICECGKKHQRVVLPNEPLPSISCPCSRQLRHLYTSRIEIDDDGVSPISTIVWENPNAFAIMDEIRKENQRRKLAENKS